MADDNNSDDALLARLKALKPTTVSLDTAPKIGVNASKRAEDDLAARFRSLASGSRSTSEISRLETPSTSLEHPDRSQEDVDFGDEENLDDLLKELGVEQSWAYSDLPKRSEVNGLLEQAKELLPSNEEAENSQKTENAGKPSDDIAQQGDDSTEDRQPQLNAEEEAETDEVIQQALAEAELSKENDGSSSEGESRETDAARQPGRGQGSEEDDDGTVALDLPSVPASELLSSQTTGPSQSEPEDLAARLAALSLPTIPKTAPGIKSVPKPTAKSRGLPTHTDEEIESWCTICCDDATVRCLGCDGDLYCTNCWREGHLSRDAGYEERKHKAVAYEKPGGKKGKNKKVLLGA